MTNKSTKKVTRVGRSKATPRLRATASKAGRRERTPRESVTLPQICRLERDGVETTQHWLSIDSGSVALYAQRSGEQPTAHITIPRTTFNRFIDWYNTGKWGGR